MQTPATFAHGHLTVVTPTLSPCLRPSAALTCLGACLQANWSAAVSHENQLLHQHQQLLERELAAPDRSAWLVTNFAGWALLTSEVLDCAAQGWGCNLGLSYVACA